MSAPKCYHRFSDGKLCLCREEAHTRFAMHHAFMGLPISPLEMVEVLYRDWVEAERGEHDLRFKLYETFRLLSGAEIREEAAHVK